MNAVTVEIEVDTSPAIAALRRIREAIETCKPSTIIRAAIERYDIPESDIRRVEGHTVVLWNRRRIAIDPNKVVRR